MTATGLRVEFDRILVRCCCPKCRVTPGAPETALSTAQGALTCERCSARFPAVAGIPDLRGEAANAPASATDRRALDFYERVYSEESYGREDQIEHVGPLRELLAEVPADGLVLELGTGLGALQQVHPAYVGTDLSIEALVRRIRGAAFASDARNLPLRSGSVDFVFSVAVLEHVPDPERALGEILRVLRPGGRAYLAPAWNCRSWAAEGLHVRPYADLTPWQRVRKASIPVRNSLAWRGAFAIPERAVRRAAWMLRRRPLRFRYRPLEANFEIFWASDSDATAQLDPHETALYFESRDWIVESPPTALGRIFHRAQPLIVRRPEATT